MAVGGFATRIIVGNGRCCADGGLLARGDSWEGSGRFGPTNEMRRRHFSLSPLSALQRGEGRGEGRRQPGLRPMSIEPDK
jgi:hypothetical protein